MLAPIGALAAPSLAQAVTPPEPDTTAQAQLQFAGDADWTNGGSTGYAGLPADWLDGTLNGQGAPELYLDLPATTGTSGTAEVCFTGAPNTTDTIEVLDDSGTVLGSGSGDADGNACIPISYDPTGDSSTGYATDVPAGEDLDQSDWQLVDTSDTTHNSAVIQVTTSDQGGNPASITDRQTNADNAVPANLSEDLGFYGFPDTESKLYLNGASSASDSAVTPSFSSDPSVAPGALDYDAAYADLAVGANTAQLTDTDPFGNTSASAEFTFVTQPGVALTHTYGTLWTTEPTFQLTGIAANASTLTFNMAVYDESSQSATQYSVPCSLSSGSGSGTMDGATVSVSCAFDPSTGTGTVALTSPIQWSSAESGDEDYYVSQTVAGTESNNNGDDALGIGGQPNTFAFASINSGVPAISADFNGSSTTETQPWFFSASPNAEYTITGNGTDITSGVVNGDPSSTYWQPSRALTPGTYTLSVQAVDDAGDVAPDSDTATLTFTVTAPSPGAGSQSNQNNQNTTPTPTTPTPTTPTPTTPTPTTPTPTTPAPTTPTTKAVTSSLNNALGKVGGKTATTAAVLKSGGATLTFSAPSAGTVTIAWYAKIKGKKTLIGSVTKTLGGSGATGLKVKLDAAGKKLLKGGNKSVKITESGSFTPKGGKKSTTTKTLKLKG